MDLTTLLAFLPPYSHKPAISIMSLRHKSSKYGVPFRKIGQQFGINRKEMKKTNLTFIYNIEI